MGITIEQLSVERVFKALDSPPDRRLVRSERAALEKLPVWATARKN